MHIKDAMEVKQEKVRRMKKRDYLRLRLIRIFELLADREVFRYWYYRLFFFLMLFVLNKHFFF